MVDTSASLKRGKNYEEWVTHESLTHEAESCYEMLVQSRNANSKYADCTGTQS